MAMMLVVRQGLLVSHPHASKVRVWLPAAKAGMEFEVDAAQQIREAFSART
jgi:hypothetical protein